MSSQSQQREPGSSSYPAGRDSGQGLKFADWSVVGTKTFTPDDLNEVVGSFVMDQDANTLWTRITLLSPATPWPWSYGILGFKKTQGYELGSVKAYPEVDSEVFRLGVGRPPSERSGLLTFEPRSFNLAWIRNGYPLTLKFECASGVTGGGSSDLAVINSFVRSTDGSGLQLVQVDFS